MSKCACVAVALAVVMAASAEPVKKAQTVQKDPTLVALEQVARRQHNRAVVIDKTVRRYKPEDRSELIVRDARQSYQERLHAARKAVKEEAEGRLKAEDEAKAARDLRKAAKRSEKNLEKILKTLNQAIKKASDADEVAVYQGIIDMLGGE